MEGILNNAVSMILLIAAGYLFRRLRLLPPEAFTVLSRIVIYFTLPAAVAVSMYTTEITMSMAGLFVLGAACNIAVIAAADLISRGNKDTAVFRLLTVPGYNVGTFTMPFAQSFFGVQGMAVLSMFDAGNSMFCLGLTNLYVEGKYFQQKGGAGAFVKRLGKAATFLTLMVMLGINLAHIRLPDLLIQFLRSASSANTTLSMLMIGLSLKLDVPAEKWNYLSKGLVMKYGLNLLLAVAVVRLFSGNILVRNVLVLTLMAPMPTVYMAYLEENGGDYQLAGAFCTLSILVSIVLMTGSVLLLSGR